MNRTTYILFVLALIIFGVAFFFYRRSYHELLQYNDLINKSHEVISGFEKLSNDLKSAQVFSEKIDSAGVKGLAEVYKRSAGNISYDLANLQQNIMDSLNKRRLDTLTRKINNQLDWIMQSNIQDTLILGHAPERVAELLEIQNLIDSSISTARVVMIDRRAKLDDTLSLNNFYILAFRVFSLMILLFTIVLVIRHAKQKEKGTAFLDSVLNSSQNGIISYKAVRKKGVIINFKIVYANEAVRDNTGLDPGELVWSKVLEISPESSTNGVFEKFCQVAESNKKLRYEVTSKRGTFDVLLAKFMDGVTASFFNITEMKNSREDLKNKVGELEQSNYELEQYAYVASHDLQEPLRKIRIFGGLIRDRS